MSVNSRQDDTAALLSAWSERVVDIPERGLEASRVATAQERAEIAKSLGLLGCEKLSATYRILAMSGARYRLAGEFQAYISQPCVITLAPVEAEIVEKIEEEFWPPELVPLPKRGEAEEQEALAAGIAPEMIRQGHIEVGRIVFEQLATALNPYPRAEGAAFSGPHSSADSGVADNPFAALQRLKDKT
ncbi:MAG: YceD family protein [Hyphomicrobiaceae bacterium]